jgi:hypothetical protein
VRVWPTFHGSFFFSEDIVDGFFVAAGELGNISACITNFEQSLSCEFFVVVVFFVALTAFELALELILATRLPLYASQSTLTPLTITQHCSPRPLQWILETYPTVSTYPPLPVSSSDMHPTKIASTVWIYLFFLPFQLVGELGWFTIGGVGLAAFVYLGFLAAGEEVEHPFGESSVFFYLCDVVL